MKITNDLNDQLMVMASHRYCLGRSSYIVGACKEWLNQVWNDLEPNTQSVIIRDTTEALMDNRAGMSYDIRSWTEFNKMMWSKITEEQKKWVKESLAYKHKSIEEFI